MQKTNFKTRLLALLTAVFMVIMCVPFAAFADNTVTVGVRFIDNDTKDWINKDALVEVEASQSEAEAGAITIPADKMPQNYVIASQVVFNNNGRWLASVYLDKKPAAPAEQTVTVYYWDYTQSKTEAVASKEFKVAADAEKLNVTADMAPEGYDIAADSLGEHAIIKGAVSIFVEKKAAPAEQTVTVYYWDYTQS
ncbi:hypothetical protein, partial [Gemmiger sp.]|uniref:hypothetical protein n=1 Tax=Gemmiger sp. TaxID=2049027 RepID=UPI00307C1D73